MKKEPHILAHLKVFFTQNEQREYIESLVVMALLGILSVVVIGISVVELQQKDATAIDASASYQEVTSKNTQLLAAVSDVSQKYNALLADDQLIKNEMLTATISAIEKTYQQAADTYEELAKLREIGGKTEPLDGQYAEVIALLSEKNHPQANRELTALDAAIAAEKSRVASTFTIPANVAETAVPPGSGYQRQKVTTSLGAFMVDVVAGDLSSTKVLVDTAAESDCGNDCPVLPLATYVSRNGAYAGVNGSYFCPTSYPSCAGKTNSFDTLLMNKNKQYFNSDNNVYSSVPAVIFGGGYVRFVGASSQWGRDTGIDSMIANQPLLVSGGSAVFGGDGDPKKGSKSNRPFVANKGNTVYIGIVYQASVADASQVLASMGMESALNLDSGGSTAFWYGGYKVGPGRNIPNAILFVRK